MDLLGFLKEIKDYAEFIISILLLLVVGLITWGLFPKQYDNKAAIKIYLKKSASAILFVFLSLLIAFVILVYIQNFGQRNFSSEPEAWGQAGDFFGGMLNPILAFASFIALLYTLKIQSEQIAEARFEQIFSQMIDAFKNTVKPDMSRIKVMHEHRICYDAPVSIERRSSDFFKHYQSSESSCIEFAEMFYECVDLLHAQKSTKPFNWTVLASQLSPSDCYFVISLIGHKDVNFMGVDKLIGIAKEHRLFRKARLFGDDKFVSIGCGDSRTDGAWTPLSLLDFKLSIEAFKRP